MIDGSDGSGKSTQSKLLLEYLEKQSVKAKHQKFPQYEKFFGQLVARFLRGEFGTIDQVSPYLASVLYANDRASAKEDMENYLNEGGYLVLDRYATSNMGHQGAKFKTVQEREEFIEWDYQMEYEINKLPKEDVVIYLYVPYEIASQLRAKETNKEYLKGKVKDIHEEDKSHLIAAEKTYQYLAEKYDHWIRIDCVKDDKLLSIEEIHAMIVEQLKARKII